MSPKALSRAVHQKELTRQSCAIRKITRSHYSGLSAGARPLAVNAYADRTQAIDQTALSAYVRFGGDLLTDTSLKAANVLVAIASSVKASTFETYFGVLRRILMEIGREEVLDTRVIANLVRGVRRRRQPARRARALLAHEVERMIAGFLAQGDLESRRDAHLLMGAFAGALRSAEALSLRAETLGPSGFADLSIAAACEGEADSEQSRVFLVSWSDELNVQERMMAWAIELDGRGGGWLFQKVVDGVIVVEPCSYPEYAH